MVVWMLGAIGVDQDAALFNHLVLKASAAAVITG